MRLPGRLDLLKSPDPRDEVELEAGLSNLEANSLLAEVEESFLTTGRRPSELSGILLKKSQTPSGPQKERARKRKIRLRRDLGLD